MTFFEIAILIIAGLLVGFINTLAGGATIISLTALMFLGLPINVANGTHRIAALFQTLTSVITFRSRHVLDWKKGFLYGIPIVLGSVPGALLAVEVNEVIFEKIVAVLMIFMALFLFYKPRRWITGKADQLDRPFTLKQGFIFFILGLYGGFIYVGMGYFLLATIVLSAGYDVVRANAIKALVVLMYVPLPLESFCGAT